MNGPSFYYLCTQYRLLLESFREHNEWSSPTSFVRLMLCSLALVDTLPPCFRPCRVGAFALPAVFLPLHGPRPAGWILVPCPGVIPKAKSKARRVLLCTVQTLWASTDIPAASRLPAWAPKQAAWDFSRAHLGRQAQVGSPSRIPSLHDCRGATLMAISNCIEPRGRDPGAGSPILLTGSFGIANLMSPRHRSPGRYAWPPKRLS